MEKLTTTYSSMQCFKTCRQMYHYRHVQKLVPKETAPALSFGSAVHLGLETWFNTFDAEQALAAAVKDAEQLGPTETAKARAMLTRYFELYAEHDKKWRILGIEREFCGAMYNPATKKKSRTLRLAGRVDGLVEEDGRVYILEHKTATEISDAYVDRVSIDTQIQLYALALRSEGVPVVGAIYDVLKKPNIRLKNNEEIDAFYSRCLDAVGTMGESFRRVYVDFTWEQLEESAAQAIAVGREMKKPVLYKNTGACVQYNRPCPYLPLCRASGNIESCKGLYEEKRSHSELSQEYEE